jgi:hypothetical protein
MEVAAFLRDNPAESDRLLAWLSEIRHRRWPSAEALCADFGSVDASRPPLTIFQLRGSRLRIETLIDFRTSVVLLLGIRLATSQVIWGNA